MCDRERGRRIAAASRLTETKESVCRLAGDDANARKRAPKPRRVHGVFVSRTPRVIVLRTYATPRHAVRGLAVTSGLGSERTRDEVTANGVVHYRDVIAEWQP